jgi:outer membrane protein assembly factor BamB
MSDRFFKNKTKVVIVCLAALGACSLIAIYGAIGFLVVKSIKPLTDPEVHTPSAASRAIVRNSLPLSEKWRATTFNPFQYPPMKAIDNLLLVEGRDDDAFSKSYYYLSAFDAQTGALKWKIGDLLGSFDVLNADREWVYLGYAAIVIAYDLDDGKELWRSEPLATRDTIDQIDIQNGSIIVYTDEHEKEQVIWVLDARSGEIKETRRYSYRKLFCGSSTHDYWIGDGMVWAGRKGDQDPLDATVVKDVPIGPCYVTSEGFVIIRSDPYDARLYAISEESGQVAWTYSDVIISNVVQSGKILYAIRKDGSLVGIDIQSGREIGRIEFSQAQDVVSQLSEPYVLSADDNQLHAYWGDSQELITFEVQGLR